jgi:hypothetical protein
MKRIKSSKLNRHKNKNKKLRKYNSIAKSKVYNLLSRNYSGGHKEAPTRFDK